ncbi:UbiH/UbiF family hydroxylase [Xanthobacter agilis]|uniref:2-octaprenyl-6-methoxyphenol hydroxylase n=1 Tax=Xanthobacter agilis TaxID=47492 RepID=A0ABU0LB31_XANAG|nr:UbiH/UbiF family hydroxylase [Xanthobacter agilis]MDQ0504328.1 2-octaprenyl-6-methoxyphenol hydroxylase [Xanthobacter agilis]
MATEDARNLKDLHDVVVVGAGPAGLVMALGLAARGVSTALVTGPERGVDHRTTALLDGSVRILEAFGLWEGLAPKAAPLRDMRIADATRRLFRAPEVTFRSAEIGLDAFGYNIENDPLRLTLMAAAMAQPALHIARTSLTALTVGEEAARLDLADGGQLRARLVVGADGRGSTVRAAAGIDLATRAYPQVAFTATVRHSRPHEDISTEFHTESGPFTLVPLPGERSSIVCVVSEREAVRLLGLSDEALSRELETRAASILGRFEVLPGRGAFPLTAETAERLTAPRIALIAEAAHIMPPIGAQGLNLGLRDVAELVAIVEEAAARGHDAGGPDLLERYARARRPDIEGRMRAVDVLNRSLLSDVVPIQGVRGFGLYLLDRVGPLRRTVMKLGVGSRAA